MQWLSTKREKKMRKGYRNAYIVKVAVEAGLCTGFLIYGLYHSTGEMIDNLKIMGLGIVSAFWAEQAVRDIYKYRCDIIEERNEIEKQNRELALENKRLKEEKEQENAKEKEQEIEQEKVA